jgi:hypothetical protein
MSLSKKFKFLKAARNWFKNFNPTKIFTTKKDVKDLGTN